MTGSFYFNSYTPSKDEYAGANIRQKISYFMSVGDSASVAQLLAAEASVLQTAEWLEPGGGEDGGGANGTDGGAGGGGTEEMTPAELAAYEEMLVLKADSNAQARFMGSFCRNRTTHLFEKETIMHHEKGDA